MLFVDNGGSTDAHRNLALEEYILRHRMGEEDLLLFYVNAPAIIIGRNQNTIEEIAAERVAERGIRVVRRISGGGAVYHDLGNLNFSFMTRDVGGRFNRYETFNRPVVEVLQALGVPAEIGGRNDILAGGRKISGNAQFASADRMLSHGTLLLDSNLDDVTAALRPKPGKVESKGVKSVRSRVANISEFLSAPMSVVALRDRILERLFGTRDRAKIPTVLLGAADWEAVEELRAKKYGTWDW
ncbi:MAG: biotin/lipoate A/B protein ligase family protein, partial [Gemmatimonadales bacterium]